MRGGAEAPVASVVGRRDIRLMSKDFPLDKLPPGSQTGDFVALDAVAFQKGYATLLHGLAGLLPRDPDFPTEYNDAITGKLQPLEDTPTTRAIYAAGKLFTDDARRISFLWRVENVMPIADSPKYAKWRNDARQTMDFALLEAVATVPCNPRLTKKELRTRFEKAFRVAFANMPDKVGPPH
jgi:hypothetical protein